MAEHLSLCSVPLVKVVLYKHGIGYFERRGRVIGPAEVPVVCAAEAIDDMLKSLLVLNVKGGRLSAVVYDCARTVESRLAEYGIDVGGCRGLVDLIGRIKGTPVTVVVSGERTAGRVLGLDETKQWVGDTLVEDQLLVVFAEDRTFKRFSLASISAIEINDESLATEIKEQLELLILGAKKRDARLLKVRLEEEVERDVIIAYSIPCPIWKTSYRLVFLRDGGLLVQGTAIVDNVQDEDWTDVEMVLVSAAPISFIQPLYDPIEPQRVTIEAQGVQSSGPVVAERAHKSKAERVVDTRRQSLAMPALVKPLGAAQAYAEEAVAAFPGAAAPAVAGREAFFSEFAQQELKVAAEESGELFEYRIDNPVSVPRNNSALIPIVNETIEGERVSLYNSQRHSRFPYAAVRLKNTTGLTLEAGPVTVMEEDAYAGEALLDVLRAGDARLLPYALDQGVHVVVRSDYKRRPIWRVRAVRGMLYLDYRERYGQVYELENVTDRARTVLVEHPINPAMRLVVSEKPFETTASYYRFRIELAAREAHSLEVWEETDAVEEVRIEDPGAFDLPQVEWLLKQNFLDKKFMEFLKIVMERRGEILDLEKSKRQAEQLLAQYRADQERARENLKTLGTSNERYRKAVDQAEDKIIETTGLINEMNETVIRKRAEYAKFVETEIVLELEREASGVE